MTGKKRHIIFQHGWGFLPGMWEKWFPFLPENTEKTILSRGYFGEESSQLSFHKGTFNMTVCHSLGLHLLSREILQQTNVLAVFGGFKHFHGETGFQSRLSKKIVTVMLAEIEKNPEKVLATFYNRCDLKESFIFKGLNKKLLVEDLLFLDNNHLDLNLLKAVPRILLFHGKKDRIVPVERSESLNRELPNSELVIYDHRGHGLPFIEPEKCIREIIQKTDDV